MSESHGAIKAGTIKQHQLIRVEREVASNGVVRYSLAHFGFSPAHSWVKARAAQHRDLEITYIWSDVPFDAGGRALFRGGQLVALEDAGERDSITSDGIRPVPQRTRWVVAAGWPPGKPTKYGPPLPVDRHLYSSLS